MPIAIYLGTGARQQVNHGHLLDFSYHFISCVRSSDVFLTAFKNGTIYILSLNILALMCSDNHLF